MHKFHVAQYVLTHASNIVRALSVISRSGTDYVRYLLTVERVCVPCEMKRCTRRYGRPLRVMLSANASHSNEVEYLPPSIEGINNTYCLVNIEEKDILPESDTYHWVWHDENATVVLHLNSGPLSFVEKSCGMSIVYSLF